MGLKELEIKRIRNISSLIISPAKQFNLIVGPNGSGKTSLLEGIHLLGLGRSFRTASPRKLIQEGTDGALVFGQVDTGGREVSVGVSKSQSGETVIRVGGTSLDSAAGLAELMPLQLIGPNAHELIEGEPQLRRAFIDWGLFHVEHGYLDRWRKFRRLLQQRNAALKQQVGAAEIRHWDIGLAAVSEEISASRQRYISGISVAFEQIYRRLTGSEPAVGLTVRRGWPSDGEFADVLARNMVSDRRMGFTTAGPHRAELRVSVDGKDAADFLSRGQKKLAVCALRLAQVATMADRHGKQCVVLVDDLPAELDMERRGALLEELYAAGAQCFITGTEHGLMDMSEMPDTRVFHVEHGALRDVV